MARKSQVKEQIREVWDEHHDWTAGQVQAGVIKGLGEKRSKGGTYPGLRLVQKYVSEFIERLGELADEDSTWSIGASIRSNITPEATKDLFDIWRMSLAMGRPISIRQAKWIVYIRNLFRQPISVIDVLASTDVEERTKQIYSAKVNRSLWLIRQSWLYSVLERTSRIMGDKPFDTTNLDAESFMLPWEHATASRLGTISPVNYSQDALTKLEKHGTSLTSPAVSITSVEQAVWFSVRAEPLNRSESMSDTFDEILPEQDDLVAAYWLTYLSKGPLWNDLPEPPEIREFNKGRLRNLGRRAPPPGPSYFADDSMYSRQLRIRRKLLEWVKTDSIRRWLLHPVRTGSLIEEVMEAQKADLPGDTTPPFNATLLKTVGYEVTAEELDSWLKLHLTELLARHKGFRQLATDVQTRFVYDEETYEDKELLEEADSQAKKQEQERREAVYQEFVDMVQAHGKPVNTSAFWEPIRKEWFQRRKPAKPTQEWLQNMGQTSWRQFREEYADIMKQREQGNKGKAQSEEAQNERTHS